MKITFILSIFSAFLLISCSASTGSRYEKDKKEEKKEIVKETSEDKKKAIEEDFDFTPYRTQFDIEEKDITLNPNTIEKPDIWYGYNTSDTLSDNKTSTGKAWGYRVQVVATDNLEEANSTRSDLYFKTNQKSIYVIFDPPFYKVKAGDFKNINDANSLNFKLSQMGYTESRVVQDSINVFQ